VRASSIRWLSHLVEGSRSCAAGLIFEPLTSCFVGAGVEAVKLVVRAVVNVRVVARWLAWQVRPPSASISTCLASMDGAADRHGGCGEPLCRLGSHPEPVHDARGSPLT